MGTHSLITDIQARTKARLIARLRERKNSHFELTLVSAPVHARTRRLRQRWTDESSQELKSFYEAKALPQLKRMLQRYAKKKLNKKLYGKIVIHGNPV